MLTAKDSWSAQCSFGRPTILTDTPKNSMPFKAQLTFPLCNTHGSAVKRNFMRDGRRSERTRDSRLEFLAFDYDAAIERGTCNSKYSSPLRKRQTFAFVAEQTHAAFIILLFFLSCPTTVIRGIWAVRQWPAVKAMFGRWLWPHVITEIHKSVRPSPTSTYFYASTPVTAKTGIDGVMAALNHILPSIIEARIRLAMPIITSCGCVAAQAPTGFCIATAKGARIHDNSCITNATTLPKTLKTAPSRTVHYFRNYGKAIELLTDKTGQVFHSLNYSTDLSALVSVA